MTDSDEARGVRPAWVDWTLTIAAGVLLALMVRAFVAEVYVVPSASMLETIHEGDRLVGEKVSYRLGRPSVGDVVTFNDPDGSGSTLIKRVIAIEGQTIDLRNGTLYVDGVAQSERYVDGTPSYALTQHAANLEQDISYPYTVPKGCVWVMGDNRTNSLDSRYFGAVGVDQVTSRAAFIFWPPSDMGRL